MYTRSAECGVSISIHAIAKRATRRCLTLLYRLLYFNPRPRKEGDTFGEASKSQANHFNPRPRKEGDMIDSEIAERTSRYFNPRPRKEGDTDYILCLTDDKNFNPRPRKEGDNKCLNKSNHLCLFQSTPSQRGRRIRWSLRNLRKVFQSTPS